MSVADTAAWGVVAALVFLIVAVAYRALADGGPSLPVLFVITVAVGIVGALGVRTATRR